MTLAHPPVVSQTEWDVALAAMTEREQAVAAAMHELAAERKRMPMVRVERDYSFEGPEGRRALLELFEGRTQLILYRFFFAVGVDGGPDAGGAGCAALAGGGGGGGAAGGGGGVLCVWRRRGRPAVRPLF